MKSSTILLVDDSKRTLEVAQRMLEDAGYGVSCCSDVASAVDLLGKISVDLIITDFRMPVHDGLDLIHWVRDHRPDTPIIMLTGYPSIEGAVEAVRGGAEAYLTKPFTRQELLNSVTEVLSRVKVPETASPELPLPLLGTSEEARKLRRVFQAALEDGTSMLLVDPEYSGSLEIARALHNSSIGSEKPFVYLDCGLPEVNAIALFGQKSCKGSVIASAQDGSLVLDSIASLDSEAQRLLLRLLQEKRCIPTQEGPPLKVRFRLIAITRRDLPRIAGLGRFRRDLLERLEGRRMRIPSLAERRDDLPVIITRIFREEAQILGTNPPELQPRAMARLCEAPWGGGLNELRHTLRNLVAGLPSGPLEVSDLPRPFRFNLDDGEEMPSLQQLEKNYIRRVLKKTGGNKTDAAKILGIDRKTLRSRLGDDDRG